MDIPPSIPGADEFFRAFSAFEYALKRAGYVRCGRKTPSGNHVAEPNWPEFASKMADKIQALIDDPPLDIRTLLNRPPAIHVVKSMNGLSWERRSPVRSPRDLIYALNGVRNNLFHGEKHPGDARDEELIAASLNVLRRLHPLLRPRAMS